MFKSPKLPSIYDLVRCETQEKTREYVKNILSGNNIQFYEDEYGNIYNLDNKEAPLLSAHMDTVMSAVDQEMTKLLKEDNTGIISTGWICGGDDKCGVYIILNLLIKKTLIFNFIFSTDEEVGCIGINGFLNNVENTKLLEENCLYCLVLDRKGDSDIICHWNEYGTKEFENALVKVSKDYSLNYVPQIGLFSDADYISEHISTANLSVGYYNPHSNKEYIDINAMTMAELYTEAILLEVKDKYAPMEKSYSYSRYGFGPAYDDYYNYKYGGYYDDGYYSRRNFQFKKSEVEDITEELMGLVDPEYIKNSGKHKCLSCDNYFEEEEMIEAYTWRGVSIPLCYECAFEMYENLEASLKERGFIF